MPDRRLPVQIVYHSLDTILHQNHVPVQQITQVQLGQLEVSQKLSFMDGKEPFNGLVFYDYSLLDHHINSKAQIDTYLVIL